MPGGRRLEERVAEIFRAFGCEVRSPARILGARATHQVDVWVELESLGFPDRWAIECKDRTSPVKKEHVLTFQGVVNDVGAFRGIMVSTSGFQPGATAAALHTNILLLTP